jgi:fermentation-respiration switch protein FrsA (DUF1100 family)
VIRTFAAAVVIVIVAAAAMYFFARYVRRNSMFFPLRYPEGFWDTAALPVKPEEQWFTAADGVRLNAWLFRARGPDAPLLIYFHGNAGNLGERGPVASSIASHGVSVLVFDWRGYGKSEGRPTESALYRDAIAAYEHGKHIANDISLYGESLGGPYAAYVAKERRARSVIIENSFPSLLELGNALYSPIPLGLTAPGALLTARWLNQAGVPVLLMHGKHDQVVPFAVGMSLYEQLRVPKELIVSETAGHCELASVERERYYEAVVRFAKQGR